MSKKDKKTNDEIFRLGDLPEELSNRGREVWLAGLGALATVEEEGSKMFNSLVKRGEKMEERGQQQVDETVRELKEKGEDLKKKGEETSKEVEGTLTQAETIVSQTVQRVLDRFDVPSRKEVKGLGERVEMLSKKIDELSIALEKKGKGAKVKADVKTKPNYLVRPHDDGWEVIKEGNQRANSVHENKKEATEAGRELAKNNAPSLLTIHKQSGEVQDTVTYDEA